MSGAKFEIHFHAPVGQNINNVEHMDVHVDKGGHVQVLNAENIATTSPQQEPIGQKYLTGIDAGIMAVHQTHLCNKADWAAVVKILEERNEMQKGAYSADAEYINRICGEEVTNANSISRSPIFTKIVGEYPNWSVRPSEQNRETAGKLQDYLKGGKIFTDALER